jgi:hypothetical protein
LARRRRLSVRGVERFVVHHVPSFVVSEQVSLVSRSARNVDCIPARQDTRGTVGVDQDRVRVTLITVGIPHIASLFGALSPALVDLRAQITGASDGGLEEALPLTLRQDVQPLRAVAGLVQARSVDVQFIAMIATTPRPRRATNSGDHGVDDFCGGAGVRTSGAIFAIDTTRDGTSRSELLRPQTHGPSHGVDEDLNSA